MSDQTQSKKAEREVQKNKEMIENIRKTKNPFGNNDDKDPDKLYCC